MHNSLFLASGSYVLVSEHLSGKSDRVNMVRRFQGINNPTLNLVPLRFSLFYLPGGPLSFQTGKGAVKPPPPPPQAMATHAHLVWRASPNFQLSCPRTIGGQEVGASAPDQLSRPRAIGGQEVGTLPRSHAHWTCLANRETIGDLNIFTFI